MFRFPYMRGPEPRERSRRPPAQEQQRQKQSPFPGNAYFSPQLSLLLSMVLKDGAPQSRTFEILKSIYPYVDPADRAMIDRVFGIQEFAQGYRPNLSQNLPGGRALSKQERDLHILQTLRQYASPDSAKMFNRFEQALKMQQDMTRMMNRMEMLRNTKASTPEDIFSTMEAFLPPDERKNIRNMTNMMNLFKNMGNFKPEDILKMWGMRPPQG
jgi:hypothetical protein